MRANFNDPETNCNPRRTFLQCCSTWVISFLIISPIVFEGDWFGIHWGKFGPVPNVAMCSTYSCPTGLPYYPVVYTVGFFLPLFTILISYLVVLPIKMKRIDRSIKRSIEGLKEKLKEESDINRLHPIEGKSCYVRN